MERSGGSRQIRVSQLRIGTSLGAFALTMLLLVAGAIQVWHLYPTGPTAVSPTATWQIGGQLTYGRYQHTATLLQDGRVLVVGGIGKGGIPLATAEIYDPSTRKWASAAPMRLSRSGHTATRLADGRVLVAGGFGAELPGVELNSTEIYDPATDSWVLTAAMDEPRALHTATLLSDGRVLIVGVAVNASSQHIGAGLYDPKRNTWSRTAPMVSPRIGHSAALLKDGRVIVLGGSDGRAPGYLSSGEVYDPQTDKWSAGPSMPSARSQSGAVTLANGRVLVVGGIGEMTESNVFDPATNTWSSAGNLATGRVLFNLTLLPDGHVLVSGGLTQRGADPGSELYDPVTNRWSPGPTLAAGRMLHTLTLLADGSILAVGGLQGDGRNFQRGAGLSATEILPAS